MNRLIIIGNGFDIAHGMKSSTKDFLQDYCFNVIKTLKTQNIYKDKLLSIEPALPQLQIITFFKKIDINSSVEFIISLAKNHKKAKVYFHSSLLEMSLNGIENLGWVDLESLYFNQLISKRGSQDSNDIQNYIEQFDKLKELLLTYLDNQEKEMKERSDVYSDKFINSFTEETPANDETIYPYNKTEVITDIYFLNFNYTRIAEKYANTLKSQYNARINYIHGNLSKTNGVPIFGFGDEIDERYIKLQGENDNSLLKHIKSFEYLKTNNYLSLIRFIESFEFHVHIYGHSCGLSDRTLLNEIFEHPNCKIIKIYYHERDDKSNDFTEKTYDISRHFTNQGLVRKKVIPFDECKPMPQF